MHQNSFMVISVLHFFIRTLKIIYGVVPRTTFTFQSKLIFLQTRFSMSNYLSERYQKHLDEKINK